MSKRFSRHREVKISQQGALARARQTVFFITMSSSDEKSPKLDDNDSDDSSSDVVEGVTQLAKPDFVALYIASLEPGCAAASCCALN
jgi:hypothetical protein